MQLKQRKLPAPNILLSKKVFYKTLPTYLLWIVKVQMRHWLDSLTLIVVRKPNIGQSYFIFVGDSETKYTQMYGETSEQSQIDAAQIMVLADMASTGLLGDVEDIENFRQHPEMSEIIEYIQEIEQMEEPKKVAQNQQTPKIDPFDLSPRQPISDYDDEDEPIDDDEL